MRKKWSEESWKLKMKSLLICGLIASGISSLGAQEDSDRPDRLFPDKEFYTREEVMALQSVLEQRSHTLEQDIETQKEYIQALSRQVEEHLERIEAARDEIADFMNERDEKEEAKLRKLARFYENMEAEQAAPLLQRVNDDLAIKIFDRMDARRAGGILALYPPNRAARITAAFPRLRIQMERVADGE